MRTTNNVWNKARTRFSSPETFSPHILLWGNPNLPHLNTVPDPQVWARKGIVKLKHLVTGGKLRSFSDLKSAYTLPRWMLFRYCQLRHAYGEQFPAQILGSDPVEGLLTATIIDKPLSSLCFHLSIAPLKKLEKTLAKWKLDIPDLSKEDWETCVSSFVTNMILAKDRFMQVKFLHRAYYTPKRLTIMNPSTPVACPRCGQRSASFFHMT